jgi:hypothetical protein
VSQPCILTGERSGIADAHRDEIDKRTRAGGNDTFSAMKTLLSIILAFAVSISTALAKQGGHGKQGGHRGHGGYHGKHSKHFSSKSPRGGRKVSRSGSKFSSGKSGKYRNSKGRNWSGGNWSGDWGYHRFSGDRFIFIGGFGYPYYPYWGWGYPYSYSYYSYYPSYVYDYDYPCSISRKRFLGP